MADGTTAPAAPAAPSTSAPAASGPISAPGSSDISTSTTPSKAVKPTKAAPAAVPAAPAEPAFQPLKFKAKFNGAEEDVEIGSMEELQRYYQQARLVGNVGKQRKEAEARAAEAMQRWEATQQRLKADPFGYMRELGIDPNEHVRQLILENARREKMTPEERIEEARRQAEEPLRQQLTQAQRQMQQMQEQQKAAALEAWAEREYTEKLEPAFKQALQAKGVDVDEDTLREIGDEASTWLEAGVALDPAQIVEAVVARQEKGFWGRLGKQSAETLSKRLSDGQKQQLMALWVAEFKARNNPAAKPGQQIGEPPPQQPKRREYIDEAEFRRRVNGSR